jgi:hypothetical protein
VKPIFAVCIALALAGCANKEVVTTAVVVDTPKPALPRECNPANRKPFAQVRATPGNKTPPTSVDHAFVAAKKRDGENAELARLCFENIKPQFAPVEAAPAMPPMKADAKAVKPAAPTS